MVYAWCAKKLRKVIFIQFSSSIDAPSLGTFDHSSKQMTSSTSNDNRQFPIRTQSKDKAVENNEGSASLRNKQAEELHAIIEDHTSDDLRNKRIGIEESNQRVRKWLNSETSYFGPLEEDQSDTRRDKNSSHRKEANHKKDAALKDRETLKKEPGNDFVSGEGFVSATNVNTKIRPASVANIPPLTSVSSVVTNNPPRLASISQRPELATGIQQLFLHGSPVAGVGNEKNTKFVNGLNMASVANQSSHAMAYHIHNLFSTANQGNMNHPAFSNSNAMNNQVDNVSKGQGIQHAALKMKQEQFMKGKYEQNLHHLSQSSFVPSESVMNGYRESPLTLRANPLKKQSPVSGIPPLRVSPSISQLGSPRLSRVSPQLRASTPHNGRTPTRESPASQMSSLSPQASSMKTELSSPKTSKTVASHHQDLQRVDMHARLANHSSLIVPGNNIVKPEAMMAKPGLPSSHPSASKATQPISASFISNLLHPGGTTQPYQLQQQQQLAEAMKSRYMEHQRLAAANAYRPHLNSSLSQLRQGKCYVVLL